MPTTPDPVHALLTAADSMPVRVLTARSNVVTFLHLVADPGGNGRRAELRRIPSGERYTPELADIKVLLTADGRVAARPRAISDKRRADALHNLLSGLAVLVGDGALTAADPAVDALLRRLAVL